MNEAEGFYGSGFAESPFGTSGGVANQVIKQ